MIAKISAKFLAFGPTLEAVFHEMDEDKNGKISYKEFVEALNGMSLGIPKQGLYDLMRTLDTDNDNTISYHEFASRFQVSFNRVKKQVGKDEWVYKKLRKIGTKLYQISGDSSLAEQFSEFDTDKNGKIDRTEFANFLEKKLGMSLSEDKIGRLLRVLDIDGNGTIEYQEFVEAFKIFDSGNKAWQKEVIQTLYATLLKNRTQLRRAFKLFDVDGDGKVSAEEFRIGIEALNETLANADASITPLQIRELFTSLKDKDSDSINYETFLASFTVVVDEEEAAAPPKEEEEEVVLTTSSQAVPRRKPPTRQLSSLEAYSKSLRSPKQEKAPTETPEPAKE